MQGIQNNRDSREKAFMMGKIFKHMITDSQNGRKFIASMLVFELSLIFSILRSFYRSNQLPSFFSKVVASISSLILIESDSHAQVVYIIRTTIAFLLFCTLSLCTILMILKVDRFQQENMENMLGKILTVLLIFSMPFMMFSVGQVYTFGYSTALIDVLNIGLCVFLTYFVEKISGEVEYGRKGSNRTNFKQNNAGIKTLRAILGCLFILLDNQKNFFIVVALVMLILNLIELRSFAIYEKYSEQIYQRITEIRAAVSASFTALAIFITITENTLLKNNLEILLVFISALAYWSFKLYQQYKRASRIFRGIDVIQGQNVAISYALELIRIQQVSQSGKDDDELVSSFLLQNHSYRCQQAACVCQTPLNHITRKKLLKDIVVAHLRVLSNKYPLSFGLKLICIGYQLTHCDKLISLSIQVNKIMKLSFTRKLSLQNQFLLDELAFKTHKKLSDLNQTSHSIHCQNIFKEDVIKVDVMHNLGELIDLNIRKYKLLSLDCYSLNKIEEVIASINLSILKVEQNWAYLRSINSFSFEIFQIFIFYFQNIVPSPIQAKHFIEQISAKLEKVRSLKGFCQGSVNKYLYSKNTCIIVSELRQSFGAIDNITVNCSEVLGISKERLLKKQISQIMPEYFVKDHELVVTNWLEKGTSSSSIAKKVDFGYVDSRLICFQGYLFFKVHSDGEKLMFYVTIIRQNDNDYLLLNGGFNIQGIGKRLIKEQIFVKEHIHHNLFEYTKLNMEKVNLGSTYRTSILLQSLYNTPELQLIYQECSSNPYPAPNSLKFQCSIAVTKHKICKQQYFLIKFENIKKWRSSIKEMRDTRQTYGSMRELGGSKNLLTLNEFNENDDILLQEDYNSIEPLTNHSKYAQVFKAQTIKSSIHEQSSNEITFYSNFTLTIKKCFINPSNIPMNFYKKMTVFIVLVCSLLMVQFFSLRAIFDIGFDSFNSVMFGDGAVSDNNQMLEILYNNILMSKVYCKMQGNDDRCEYLLDSTKKISNILYGLYTSDIQVYLKNTSDLTNLKYYASYDIEVPFTVGKLTKNISTLQFMEYYYYAINNQHNLIKSGNFLEPEGEETMMILIDNWPQMKFINHNAIKFYLEAGSKELNLLMSYILVLIAGIGIFLMLLAGALYYNDSTQSQRKFKILSIYGFMNALMIKNLIDYYISLKYSIASEKFLPCELVDSSSGNQQTRKEMRYDKSGWCVVQIMALLAVLIILAGLEVLQVSLILQPSRSMVISINDLMDSENYMLETYFQLKTYYLQYNYSKSVDQISSQLAVILGQVESDFTKTARKSIHLFSSDLSFVEDFNNLLVNNVCKLTQPLFSPVDVNYCNNNMTQSTLSLGLVSSMTSFQRNAFEALKELQRRQKQAVNKTEYFTKTIFQDIDDSIFYMFRLYQATQARMYQGLNFSVQKSLILVDILNSCSVIVFMLLLGWWFLGFKTQRREIMELYGTVLQFPEIVMKKMVVADVMARLEIHF